MKGTAGRTAIAAAIVLVALLAAAPSASARGIFGVINQTPLGDEDVEPLREARPASLRVLVLWDFVQPTQGKCTSSGTYDPSTGPGSNHCDWSSIDQIVRVAAAAGVKTFPYLFGTPDWLKSTRKASPRRPWAPPLYARSDRGAWKRFVRAAVERYGRGGDYWLENPGARKPVREWQVWNEPTSPAYFAPRPDVELYFKLLKLSYGTIHRADPRAKVVLAGVFGTPRGRGGGIDMPEYFEQLYAIKRVERFFDIAAVHPYSPGIRGVRLQIEAVRRFMQAGGDRRTKLWISEIGWASAGPKGHTLTSTRRGQGRLLRSAFKLIEEMRRKWRIAGVNWFSWRDAPEDQSSCAACPWAGLLELDGTKKPAYRAFGKFTEPPPAIAGRITTVSPWAAAVWSPSRTRTSSSFR